MKMHYDAARRLLMTRQGRRAVLLAASGIGLASAHYAYAQTQTLYFDNNCNAANFGSGTNTWNSTNLDWSTNIAGTSDTSWVPGSVAAFQTTLTTVVSGVQSVSGLVFNGGGNSGTTPNIIAANSSAALDFGSSNFNITNTAPIAIPFDHNSITTYFK